MKSLPKVHIESWQFDLILVVGLLLLNPVIYGMRRPLSLTPDGVAYLTMAETAIPKGLLYLAGWGHVDTGTILPPLYPLLIATFNALRPESINNALALSAAATLLSSVLVYFYVRCFVSPLFAAAAVLLIQLNLYYVTFASMILTEALFLALSVLALFLAARIAHDDRPKAWRALVLGFIVALVCLARQIGLVIAAFLFAWLLLDALRRRDRTPAERLRLPVLFLIGWIALVGGYSTLLYHQTGQSMLLQHFRMQKYTVHISNTALFDKIEKLKSTDQVNYVEIYRNRRKLRELTPDGSEMLSYVLPAGGSPRHPGFSFHYIRTLRNLWDNIRHFWESLGLLLTIMTVAACIAPLVVHPHGVPWWPRLMLPGVLLTYVLGLSIVTGALARYVIVLYPLALAQVAIELGILLRWWRERKWDNQVIATAMSCSFALLLLFAPHSVLTAPQPSPRPDYSTNGRPGFLAGAPVFALLPVYSYIAGGTFRILPNDTLKRVVHYAQLTGVHWMLVPAQPASVIDVRFYTNAPWLKEPDRLFRRTDLLRYCCKVSMRGLTKDHFLFELIPSKRDAPHK